MQSEGVSQMDVWVRSFQPEGKAHVKALRQESCVFREQQGSKEASSGGKD